MLYAGVRPSIRVLTFQHSLMTKLLMVKGVPADVCIQCGEIYYTVDAAKALESLENEVLKGSAKLTELDNAYDVPLAAAH